MISVTLSVTFCILTHGRPFRFYRWLMLRKSGLLASTDCVLHFCCTQTGSQRVPGVVRPSLWAVGHGKTHTEVSRRWDLLTSHFRHNVQLLHHRAPCCVAHWHLFHKLFWSSRRLWKFETCSSQYLFNCLSSLLLKVLTFISAVFTVLFNFCCTEVEQAP